MDQSSEIYRLDTPSLYVGVLVLVGLSTFAAGAIAGLLFDAPHGVFPNPWGLLVGIPTIAGLALACSLLARRARALSRLAHRFAKAARTDDLTGLANRREANQALEVEVARALRYGHRLSCLLLDIDYFKAINDRFGHCIGDQVLVEIASRLAAAVRREDVVGRWGGEEFLVILPHTDSFGGRRVAEKLRRTVAETPIWIDGQSLQVTISLGLAELASLDPKRADILVHAADQALYEAKSAGRNRVAA